MRKKDVALAVAFSRVIVIVFACHSERSEEPPHFAFAFAFAFVVAVAFLVVIPEGDLLLSLLSSPATTKTGPPHPSHTSRRVECNQSPSRLFFFPPKTSHFDRSRSHRERRSGEIRFSTSVAHQPRSKTIKSSTKTTRFTTFYPRFSSQEITFSAPNLQKNPPENRSYREITRNSPQSTTTHYKTRRLVLSTAKWSVLSYRLSPLQEYPAAANTRPNHH